MTRPAGFMVVMLAMAGTLFAGAGFEEANVADGAGKALAVGIWYPSDAPAADHPIGPYQQSVALNGKLAGGRMPLILISHGSNGSMASHFDTALAASGFIVAAVTHAGDNYTDQSNGAKRANLTERARQVKVVIDYMLSAWPQRAHIDAGRIGMFGVSLGGFTTLVEIGGVPDFARLPELCAAHPDAPECQFVRQNHGDQLDPVRTKLEWVHDSRIRAAVVAAPAVSVLFGTDGLREVRVPVQLWRAADDDQVPDAWNTALVRQQIRVDGHVIPAGGHFAFFPPCNAAIQKWAPQICASPKGFDRAAFHREFNGAVTEFFRKKL